MKNKAISFVWNSIEIDPQWNCIKQSQKKANDKLNPIEKTNVLRIESILAQYGKLSEEKSRSNVIFFRLVIVYQSVLLQFQCIFHVLFIKHPSFRMEKMIWKKNSAWKQTRNIGSPNELKSFWTTSVRNRGEWCGYCFMLQ